MRYLKCLTAFCAALLFLIPGRAAQAGGNPFVFTLDAPLIAITGQEAILTGVIQNLGGTDIFLNDIEIAFDGNGGNFLTGDPNIFFDNVPGILAANDPAYTGPVIGVQTSPLTPAGLYTGTVTLLGGANETERTTLGTAFFQLQAVATPEPATIGYWAIGLSGLIIQSRFSRKLFTRPKRHYLRTI